MFSAFWNTSLHWYGSDPTDLIVCAPIWYGAIACLAINVLILLVRVVRHWTRR
jgi:hypothetical protein